MDMPMDLDMESRPVQPESKAGLLVGVPHDKKWELLKNILEPLFHTHKVKDIAEIMKEQHGFNANQPSYRYRFKQWGWIKNVSSLTKNHILQRAQARAVQGKPTTAIVAGRKVDGKRLKRQAKANARQEYTILDSSLRLVDHQSRVFGHFLPFGNKIFLNWNLPLAANRPGGPQSPKHPSPFGFPIATPDGVVVRTPSVTGGSPGQLAPRDDVSSPLSAAVSENVALERTHLFLHGRFDDLAKKMNDAEKATMSSWLYQFWLFAFMTSKHWGKGPVAWTRYNLDFDAYEVFRHRQQSPASAALLADSPMDMGDNADITPEIQMPSQLCRWSIHVHEEQYESIDVECDDPNFEWPQASRHQPLEERLQNALENNDFSNIASDKLPLAMPQIIKAVKRSPNELLSESFSFSIMARNEELLEEMLPKVKDSGIDMKTVYPLHIATSYLDGGSSCCNILDLLCSELPRLNAIYINDHGHTVLDNLMLTILKGHSSSSPDILDNTLTRDSRFAGIEVDLCGRWDADSPCFRLLLQSGKTQVPLNWKHKFCHTSVLAICHCITTLRSYGLLSETSGLFVKRCFGCGLSLQLSPFHVLVLTAFQLARSGCEGEDLFGMIAVLLCLLISQKDCRSMVVNGWSMELQRGWQIFCHILRPFEPIASQSQRGEPPFEDFMTDFDPDSPGEIPGDSHVYDLAPSIQDGRFPRNCNVNCEEFWDNHGYYDAETETITSQFAKRNDIGHVWAAVQTELLTYRRLNEGDSWVSDHFDCDAVLTGLQAGTAISMPLFDKGMIRPYCRCGCVESPYHFVLREQIAEYYFSNLDVWDRSSFISLPPREK